MKKTILIFLCLFAIILSAYSQLTPSTLVKLESKTKIEVIRFEGITLAGDRVFGVYPTREAAVEVLKQYNDQNKKKTNALTYKKIYASVLEVSNTESIFEEFKSLCPEGYKLISKEEYNTLMILEEDTYESALWYYMKANDEPQDIAKAKIAELSGDIKKYIIH